MLFYEVCGGGGGGGLAEAGGLSGNYHLFFFGYLLDIL